eukprot:m.159489 g.159489  ORF g.159489 m.159489 type:complete len:79 (+) comp15153_c0_seq2:795-1031(+)
MRFKYNKMNTNVRPMSPTNGWPVLPPDASDADKEVYRRKFKDAFVLFGQKDRCGVSFQSLIEDLKPIRIFELTPGQRF